MRRGMLRFAPDGCVRTACEGGCLSACAQFLDNTLSPYPGQIGDGAQSALLASNGDGIHSLGATLGPCVRGNTLVNMGDDGITVHGLFFLVAAVRALCHPIMCPASAGRAPAPTRCACTPGMLSSCGARNVCRRPACFFLPWISWRVEARPATLHAAVFQGARQATPAQSAPRLLHLPRPTCMQVSTRCSQGQHLPTCWLYRELSSCVRLHRRRMRSAGR